MVETTSLRFMAEASIKSGNSTERVLSASLLESADIIDKQQRVNREAMSVIGRLSFDLSQKERENDRLQKAVHEMTVGAARRVAR